MRTTSIYTPQIFNIIFGLNLVASASAQTVKDEQTNLPPIFGLDTEAPGPEFIPASSLEGQQVAHEENARQLLMDLSKWLGIDVLRNAQKDLDDLEAALKPIYSAVPLNEYGKLGHTAVRYVLHRLFVRRHGWFIRGLDPRGEHFNASSPMEVLTGKVPDAVAGLFEMRLAGTGLDLKETALFAAVLENLIHKETADKIKVVYRMFGDLEDQVLSEGEVHAIVDIYIAAYILGLDLNTGSADMVMKTVAVINQAYPNWPETQRFVRSTFKGFVSEVRKNDKGWNLDDVVMLALYIGERYGRWQNKECLTMKNDLMKLEGAENGCVPMANFYKPMVNTGQWQFSETPEYLRELGALDESDPAVFKVIIPNYVNSLSNCIASSMYYSVCCIDECEELLGQIERRVQAPDAQADELMAIVSELPSSTMPAKHEISKAQARQLKRIAYSHGGRVPLHGRLFMQWLHIVFPRECAYPHKSGTIRPATPVDYERQNGAAIFATLERMRSFVNSSTPSPSVKDSQCGQWQDEEEYLIPRPNHLSHLGELESDSFIWATASCVGLACAVAAMLIMLISHLKTVKAATRTVLPVLEDRSKLMLV